MRVLAKLIDLAPIHFEEFDVTMYLSLDLTPRTGASLSVPTIQSVSLCKTFSVMAVQYQYLSKFVSEVGKIDTFLT